MKLFLALILILLLIYLAGKSEYFYIYGGDDQSRYVSAFTPTPGVLTMAPFYQGIINDVNTTPGPLFAKRLRDYGYVIYGHNMITDGIIISIPGNLTNAVHARVYAIYPGDQVRESDFYDIYSVSLDAFDANNGKFMKLSDVNIPPGGIRKIRFETINPRRIVVTFT